MSMIMLRKRLVAMREEIDDAIKAIDNMQPKPRQLKYKPGTVMVNFGSFGRYADWRRLRHVEGRFWEDESHNEWAVDASRPVDEEQSDPVTLKQYRKRWRKAK